MDDLDLWPPEEEDEEEVNAATSKGEMAKEHDTTEESNSQAEENDFKKYKVKDIYKINLAHEFDKLSLRKKLFKIKCPLMRKKRMVHILVQKHFIIFF